VIFSGTFESAKIAGRRALPFSISESMTTRSAETVFKIAIKAELSERTIVS
jgi:hypothetical protein